MSNEFARNLLVEQRRRLVGTLMAYCEQNIYPLLSEPEQRELRKKVLTACAQYHDVCMDMLKASVNDGSVVNEDALRMSASIHRKVMDSS